MSTAGLLALAMLLDAAFGEPAWLWRRLTHPAVLMGRVIGWADTTFNHGPQQKLRGVLVVVALVIAMGLLGGVISMLGWLVVLIVTAILLAQKSLVDHVARVADGLRVSLGDGRRAVAMIVSRDTAQMDGAAVARSSIESAAENLSDGVIAPAFWFLFGGLPGLLIYKIINTADSLIGYRTDNPRDFGWAAARLDDVLNWVPARITACLIAATHFGLGAWTQIRDDAQKHRSPNAGWPESAMARALNIAIAGPRAYDGVMQDFPFVNERGAKIIGAAEIDQACAALWRTWGAALMITLLICLF
jgi:adenosylcobinamide-phosphate synthase